MEEYKKYNTQDDNNNHYYSNTISSTTSTSTLVELVDLTYNNRMNINHKNKTSSLITDNVYSGIPTEDENVEQNTKQQPIFKENNIATTSKPHYHQPSKSIYLPVKKPPLQ